MELVVKNGKTYWAPVSESVVINGFPRWEQEFRIFSEIYTRHFPHKSSELIQYNHIIHSISLSYTWENVYAYDKEFRIHISKYPERSWSVILQQAWSMKLHDRLYGSGNGTPANHSYNGSNTHHKGSKINEPCRKYNCGKCNFGLGCKYEHRCSYCYKFGHTILNCRKL